MAQENPVAFANENTAVKDVVLRPRRSKENEVAGLKMGREFSHCRLRNAFDWHWTRRHARQAIQNAVSDNFRNTLGSDSRQPHFAALVGADPSGHVMIASNPLQRSVFIPDSGEPIDEIIGVCRAR